MESLIHPGAVPVATGVPLATRMAFQISKPKDHQAFQRNCVVLFRAHLRDPHAQEYGRNGQGQRGIDVLARRDGRDDRRVGVQCRLVTTPLKFKKIMEDCRAALTFADDLSEIIFATTAENDTHAIDAAAEVEGILKAEGRDLRVVMLGWGELENLIAGHETAYAVFCPQILAIHAPQEAPQPHDAKSFAAQVAAELHVLGQAAGKVTASGPPVLPEGPHREDPRLHTRIDVFRDLFVLERQYGLAEKGLMSLLEGDGIGCMPWARFRIHSNLGGIALMLGREDAVISRYEQAFALFPDDPIAKSNLSLARLFQGKFDEAMSLAREALSGEPRVEPALGYLLQAAARSDWQGKPEDLIPADLANSMHADIGLSDFYRRRNVPGWQQLCLDLGRRHPGEFEFKPVVAVAVLSLAIESGVTIAGGLGPITAAEIFDAASGMKSYADQLLDVGFADEHDTVAHVSNACVLLRLCGRAEEAEGLLVRASTLVREHPNLRRLMALVLLQLGRRDEAVGLLEGDCDPENGLLLAELKVQENPEGALQQAIAISTAASSARLAHMAWHAVAEMALRSGRDEELRRAVDGMRESDAADPAADILELRGQRRRGLSDEEFQLGLRELVVRTAPHPDMGIRYFLAYELRDSGLPEDASRLLDGHVDLLRVTPSSRLYLDCLAAARRDDVFLAALERSSPELREHASTLRTTVIHAWNMGDLSGALTAVLRLIRSAPKDLAARMLKLEILLRQDKSSELLAELDEPLEDLPGATARDRTRLVSLLASFGQTRRATTLAYKLFLENQDDPTVWMAVVRLILNDRQSAERSPWEAPEIAPDVAVDIRFDDGSTRFLVVEPDVHLRKLDGDSWEPGHPLVDTIMGLTKGDRFTEPGGLGGTVVNLRHKFVAKFHAVLERYEARFPHHDGFRSIRVAPGAPGGLDELKAMLKSKKDWFDEEQKRYLSGPWPLGVMAARLGTDTIDAASGLAAGGASLKVALGNEQELRAAIGAVRANRKKGCVLDLLSFWHAWRLQTLETMAGTCGPIHVCQSVLDQLRCRRERAGEREGEERRSAGYRDGKIILTETSPELALTWREDLDRAIEWLVSNAVVCPLVAGDDLPEGLREQLREGVPPIWDALMVAMHRGLLFVSDDLPTRQFGLLLGHPGSCWSHIVLQVARNSGGVDMDRYVRWTAEAVDAGHGYIGVSGTMLVHAMRMDVLDGGKPGRLFGILSTTIGGQDADPISHSRAVMGFMLEASYDDGMVRCWRLGADKLLRLLLRTRHDDYGPILRAMILLVQKHPHVADFVRYWARGHFILDHVIFGRRSTA